MKCFVVSVLLLFCIAGSAQKLKVDKFKVKSNDITARTHPRQDINGNDCALVKVQLAAPNASFEGNVIGDIAYDTSEYLVYLSQGSKRLTLKKEGSLPLEVIFEDFGIKSLESKTVYIMTISDLSEANHLESPKIKTGWIIINSDPSGASVFINNVFVGNTPLINYKQTYGTYDYRIEHPNYHSAKGTIELSSGKIERSIDLTPAFGTISVKSNVAGANIFLDGKETGKNSPAMLTEIPSGPHNITLQLDKYTPKQQKVVVEDGQTTNISVNMDARFAKITINSIDGAEIYCNGKLIGHSNYSDDLMEGYYDIEARLAHHKSVVKQIQVVAGKLQTFALNPIPRYGSLDIISEPHNASITIDGKEVGKTPLTINNLLEGEHMVQLSLDNYLQETKKIIIREKQFETIHFKLNNNTPQYFFYLGIKSFNSKNYIQAEKWIRKAAEQGYCEAQSHLGYLYEQGLGIRKDLQEALKWYKLAANQGLPEACFRVGHMYFMGDGVEQSLSVSIKWYNKAADQGYSDAEYILGYFYENGIGVTKSYSQALKWYSSAAKHGNQNAIIAISGLETRKR